MNEEISNHLHIANDELKRIADALDTIIKMVKEDQDRSRKYMEKESEQTTRASNGPRLPAALAMAPGARPKLQASSSKLQAPSFRVDKIKLQEYKGDKTWRVATETR